MLRSGRRAERGSPYLKGIAPKARHRVQISHEIGWHWSIPARQPLQLPWEWLSLTVPLASALRFSANEVPTNQECYLRTAFPLFPARRECKFTNHSQEVVHAAISRTQPVRAGLRARANRTVATTRHSPPGESSRFWTS